MTTMSPRASTSRVAWCFCHCLHGRRSFSASAPRGAGPAVKKVPKIMLHPKRMAPLRMKPKITAPGAVKVKYRTGTPLSANKNPDIFLPTMSMQQLPLFAPAILDGESSEYAPGTAMRYHEALRQLFKVYGMSVRLRQESPYTAELTTVLTRDTFALLNRLSGANAGKGGDIHVCLTGDEWSGKSWLLTQIIAMALAWRWIIIYVPDVMPLMTGVERYEYDEAAGHYQQNEWSHRFLKQVVDANPDVLPKKIATQAHKILGRPDGHASGLETVIEAILAQKEVPVLVAVDGAQALFRPSMYVDGATLTKLDSYALSGPRLLLDLVTGARRIHRGASVIAHSHEHFDFQSAFLDDVLGVRKRRPYQDFGNLAYALLAEKLERYDVSRLDRQEAAGLFGLLRDTQRLLAAPSDRLFLRGYISSDGIAGKFKEVLTHSLGTA